jgi:hypothetical protein
MRAIGGGSPRRTKLSTQRLVGTLFDVLFGLELIPFQDGAGTEQLRREMQSLLEDLREMAASREDLAAERDADSQTIRELSSQVQEYKRKYEAAKTELRGIKGEIHTRGRGHVLTLETSYVTAVCPAAGKHLKAGPVAYFGPGWHCRRPYYRVPKCYGHYAHGRTASLDLAHIQIPN